MRPKRFFAILAASLAALVGVLAVHPARPLLMRSHELRLATPDGTELAATLLSPRWRERPLGAAVLVHGSVPLEREHVRGDARALVSLGFAVLSYDKRGCGESGGTYRPGSENPMELIVAELAGDAGALLEALRARPGLETIRCGFFGASQAGWIIPVASARLERPADFHILLSAPAVSTGIEGRYSALSGDHPAIENARALQTGLAPLEGPAGFDPLPLWNELRVPTLWLLGERDGSVPTFATLQILEALRGAGHAEHALVTFPNAGHDLRDADTGEPCPVWDHVVQWWHARIAN
jgi:pimeloyl-ACP methyl ester carboxylesterase